ncbi:MAG: phosphate ABC transporter permease PstA [Candidatus Thermoplasmatota archaeon]|nr:phosphate ABC transporter permease PstA [Candidatus Thermoplasmatota archaeon]
MVGFPGHRATEMTRPTLTKKVSGLSERVVLSTLFSASSVAVLISAAILYTLMEGSYKFFRFDEVTLVDFLFGGKWIPSGSNPSFGIYPLLSDTLLITGGTILIAGPLGIAAALFLSEYAPMKLRTVAKPVVELLAGIPSIVYGFFALFTIGPLVRDIFPEATYFNALQAVIVMSFMVLPIIVSISDDSLRAVPMHMREASLAMGATKWETSLKVVIPAASSGIAASVLLGVARAIGETMVVALAAGSIAGGHWNMLKEVMPMTSFIAQTATGDIPPGTPQAEAAFAVGLTLFIMTFIVNRIAGRVVLRIKKGSIVKKEPGRLEKLFREHVLRKKWTSEYGSVSDERKIVNRPVRIDRSHKFIDRGRLAGNLQRRKAMGYAGVSITALSLVLAFVFLVYLLFEVFISGAGVISWDFLTAEPGFRVTEASIMPAIAGSVFLMLLTLIFAIPLGVATAVYFNEIARDTWYTRFLRRLIQNLAGVPSIVFGLVGLAIFVRMLDMGTSLLAGSLTLALMIMPIIVVASEEALRSVPQGFREAARGVGATKWQTVKHHVLPNAVPGIITGSILALSRAIGETAPILFIGAMFAKTAPDGVMDSFVALPLTIFFWSRHAKTEFHDFASGTILVLLVILLTMNALAIFIRYRSQKRRDW